jgi:1-acyl-sn-glycerol-3-phosphate acyltransferase
MDTLRALTDINLDDLVDSFGWSGRPAAAALLRKAFYGPAKKFARQMLRFDAQVAAAGLPLAAQALFRQYAQGMNVLGKENIPSAGPALFLSNHPGMVDTLALFIAIARPDLKIVAVERPFLQALTNTSKQLIFISDDPAHRMAAVRQAAAHLKNGGAVLTFPAGKIEPDPNVYPGAESSLSSWSNSAGVFARFAPGTQVIPTLVRGVLWEKAVKHPLTYLFKQVEFERQKLGAALQLLAHIAFDQRPLHVTVIFGAPIPADRLNADEIHTRALAGMRENLNAR